MTKCDRRRKRKVRERKRNVLVVVILPSMVGWWKELKEDLNEVTARTGNVWRASFLFSFDGTFFHSP